MGMGALGALAGALTKGAKKATIDAPLAVAKKTKRLSAGAAGAAAMGARAAATAGRTASKAMGVTGTKTPPPATEY